MIDRPQRALPRRVSEAKMRLLSGFRGIRRHMAVAFAAGAITALGSYALPALPQYTISQKDREFHPGEISITRGDTIQIVNDDGDLLHHAYVDSPSFSFDSGDQKPGSVTPVTFTVAGDFDVLCAIHPKMLLVVHVK
jgi:plastocyanin